jgi:hypothetical protein
VKDDNEAIVRIEDIQQQKARKKMSKYKMNKRKKNSIRYDPDLLNLRLSW